METIYTGAEFKRLLKEGNISGYNPIIGGNASVENEKINKKSNKDSMEKTTLKKVKDESKPVIHSTKNPELTNNKNSLNLEYDNEPSKEFKERIKKLVAGDQKDPNNKGNKAFYDAVADATKEYTDNKKILQKSGLTSKNMPEPKIKTAFEEVNKTKKLNFKNTEFLNEKHVKTLIPEDYKKNGNVFIMKDKNNNQYMIEWKTDEKTNISEGVILKYENKEKLVEEFDKMKRLYGFNSKDVSGVLKNGERVTEENMIRENLNKLRKISE